MAGVPSSEGLLDQAASANTISGFMARIVGGVALVFTYLVVNPFRELGVGIGNIISKLSDEVGRFMAAFPAESADILQAGGGATEGAVAAEGILGFILAVVIVFAALLIVNTGLDLADVDIPYLGVQVPYFGADDDGE